MGSWRILYIASKWKSRELNPGHFDFGAVLLTAVPEGWISFEEGTKGSRSLLKRVSMALLSGKGHSRQKSPWKGNRALKTVEYPGSSIESNVFSTTINLVNKQ